MAERTAGGWNAEEAGVGSASVDTVRSGHGRSCPGSRGLSPVPTMLTGPGNGHCGPGDAAHCNARLQCTYVEQRCSTMADISDGWRNSPPTAMAAPVIHALDSRGGERTARKTRV